MPEAEVIGRVDGEHTVVSPTATRMRLNSRTLDEQRFALRQRIQRIRSEAPRISDRGHGGRT